MVLISRLVVWVFSCIFGDDAFVYFSLLINSFTITKWFSFLDPDSSSWGNKPLYFVVQSSFYVLLNCVWYHFVHISPMFVCVCMRACVCVKWIIIGGVYGLCGVYAMWYVCVLCMWGGSYGCGCVWVRSTPAFDLKSLKQLELVLV